MRDAARRARLSVSFRNARLRKSQFLRIFCVRFALMETDRLFNERLAAEVAGLSLNKLRRWDNSGVYSADVRDVGPGSSVRLYSFSSLVGLRTLARLHQVSRVPLDELVAYGEALRARGKAGWHDVLVTVVNGEVTLVDRERAEAEGLRSGQGAFFEMLEFVSETRNLAELAAERSNRNIGRIERVRGRLGSAPVIAGTRIPVSAIHGFSRSGYSIEEILSEYPQLHRRDVEAALEFCPKAG